MDLRATLRGRSGPVFAVILVVAGAAGIYASWRNIVPPNPLPAQMFVEVADNKPFAQDLAIGMRIPIKGPNGTDAYPAEACYWTPDGHPKDTPDYVVLNSYLGKSGPTFCPVCHRLVVFHNPKATAGAKPPPTQEEYFGRQ